MFNKINRVVLYIFSSIRYNIALGIPSYQISATVTKSCTKPIFFAQDQSILTKWNSRNYFGLALDVLKNISKKHLFYNFVESNSLICFCYISTFLDLLVSYI